MKTKTTMGHFDIYLFIIAAAVISLFYNSCKANLPVVSDLETESPFFKKVDYNAAVPKPQMVLGFGVGDKAVRYDAFVRYLQALAQSSRLVRLSTCGRSHKGRMLYYLTITSEDNHNRLADIQSNNSKLADPRTLSGDGQAERILETMPAIAWLQYSIHGDELSSTEAAIYLAYHLAASQNEETQTILDKVVINIGT